MPSARVTSIDAIVAFRAAVIAFLDRGPAALGSLRQETHRTMMWLEQEQPRYWQEELRKGYDRIASARTALDACRMRTVAGHRSACIEEQVALRKAKERVDYCQEQADITRRWALRAREEADEFLGKIAPLDRSFQQDVPNMVAVLERMILAIEAYQGVTGDLEGDLPQETTTDVEAEDPS
ncbi:MAG TPA: hypothetical protein VFG20_11505 [Planctomycetaceae bacterium]|nr:hypothetical protein [Planctomycetaceae bacterium]